MCTLSYRIEESYRYIQDSISEMVYSLDLKPSIKDGMQSFQSREEAAYYYMTASRYGTEVCEMHIISRWQLDRVGW